MRRSPLWLTMLALSACGSGDSPDEAAALTIGPLLAERVASLDPNEVGLSMPRDLALTENGLLVLDRGNHRVVHFSRSLEPLGSFGREGGGPSEFRSPHSLTYRDGRVYVSDVGNRRISTFALDGTLLSETPLPTDSDFGRFAVTADGGFVGSTMADGHYLSRWEDGTTWRHLGTRPASEAGTYHARNRGVPRLNHVMAGPGDTLYLADSPAGELVTLGPDGAVLSRVPIPDSIRTAVRKREYRIAVSLVGRDRAGGVYTPLFGDAARLPTGEVLVTLKEGHLLGLLIDPRTATMRPLLAPPGDSVPEPLRNFAAATIKGDSLFMLSMDGIRIYQLRQQR